MAGSQPAARRRTPFHHIENALGVIVLALIPLLPIMEAVARGIFRSGIPHSTGYIKHLVLWVCFVGGMITSREKRHLSLSAGVDLIKQPIRGWIETFTGLLSFAVIVSLFFASLSFLLVAFAEDQMVGFIPVRLFVLIMPIGFAVMAVRSLGQTPEGTKRWIAGTVGLLVALGLSWSPGVRSLRILLEGLLTFFSAEPGEGLGLFLDKLDFDVGGVVFTTTNAISLPLLVLLLLSATLGTPIFVILGGAALLFFFRTGGFPEVVADEAYVMLKGDIIPAIPLFTLAGFILSESRAGERLVRLFRAFFGWLPGGLAVMSVLVCAFFTTFTGGSGVTILAIGGLLSFVLIQSRYRRDFSLGLLTSSGSIGLLFPPSLPIILYAFSAQINIKEMFVGGFLPGVLMVLVVSLIGVRSAVKNRVPRVKLQPYEIIPTLSESRWEVLLPVIILISYFAGFTTLVETSALAVVYVLIIEVLVHRDIRIRELPNVFLKCIPIIGGVLMILAAAKGLSFYIVDAEIPTRLTEWFQSVIHSKYVFLILLNLALLVTGCLMDIFSAIAVVAPLVIPLGVAYGIHPVHLGVIFLANLELGYLTPPVGINLFLASYRFEEPLSKIYRDIIPFFLALLASVLIITYVPQLSTWLLGIIRF